MPSIHFNRAADYYDETRAVPPDVHAAWIASIIDHAGLTDSDHVVEFGVGTGRIARTLAPQVGSYMGIDPAPAMLQRIPSGDVLPVQADITRLPLATASVDAIVVVHVFHLIPNWRDAIREAARILRPGGRLILASSGISLYDVWDKVDARLNRARPEPIGADWRTDIPSELTAQGWQHHGTKIEATHTQPYNLRRFVDQVRLGQHSWTWLTDSDYLMQAADTLAAILSEDYGDIDQTVTVDGFTSVDVWTRPPQD